MSERTCKIVIPWAVLALSLLPGITNETMKKTSSNYGPYRAAWSDLALCKGPKTRNVSEVAARIDQENGHYVFYLNLTFAKDALLYEYKSTVYNLDGGKRRKMFEYKAVDPCRSMFNFAEITRSQFGTADCRLKKGFHTLRFDFSQMVHVFFGSKFYYGKMFLHNIVMTREGNMVCFNLIMEIKKK